MLGNRKTRWSMASSGLAVAFAMVPVAACSSDDASSPADGGPDGTTSDGGGSDAGVEAASACAHPGGPTAGPKDDHCTLDDGGMMVQPTSQASCMPDVGAPGDDGGDNSCAYGATNFGQESDDDDCKYHVKWSSTPICEGAPGAVFTVVATNKGDGSPLTGAQPGVEAFTTSPGDWDAADFCDTMSTHPSAPAGGGYWPLTEGPAGTYTGPVQFDVAGQWTVRFHFYHECLDVLPDSPHGHSAYHITVP